MATGSIKSDLTTAHQRASEMKSATRNLSSLSSVDKSSKSTVAPVSEADQVNAKAEKFMGDIVSGFNSFQSKLSQVADEFEAQDKSLGSSFASPFK